MGIDNYSFRLIQKLVDEHKLSGAALTLGRQSVNRANERAKVKAFVAGLSGTPAEALPNANSFELVEAGFRNLGFSTLDAMDVSDYQGANILQDLTQEVPGNLVGKYDLIYDGGTTEHIFDLPVALANLRDMLRVGGVLVSVNMLNGSPGHGLYQFGPDLVWSYWKRGSGFDVLSCAAQPVQEDAGYAPFEIPDIGAEGKRFPLKRKLPKGSVFLTYAVRKTAESRAAEKTYQTDYVVKWNTSGSAQERIEG